MGLLRSVKDGVVLMDGRQLNGANRGMERDVGQEARLNVVKKVSSGYTRNSISYKSYCYLFNFKISGKLLHIHDDTIFYNLA